MNNKHRTRSRKLDVITIKELMEPFFRILNRAPFNIAPERSDKLAEEILGIGEWTLQESNTEANMYAMVSDRSIRVSWASLGSVWCLSYVAVRLMDLGVTQQRKTHLPEEMWIDISAQWETEKFDQYLAYVRTLFREEEFWPAELSVPKLVESTNSEDGRINNVFLGAMSWLMLHEIGHIYKEHIRFIPNELRVSQEYEADDFATRWILESARGIDREFRILIVCVALAWLFLNEETRGQGADHPPAFRRYQAALPHFKAGGRSAALEQAAYLFKALFDPTSTPPRDLGVTEFFEWMSATSRRQRSP